MQVLLLLGIAILVLVGLPALYAARARVQWQADIRRRGIPGEATIDRVTTHAIGATPGRWRVEFSFRLPDADDSPAVHSALIIVDPRQHLPALKAGDRVAIHYLERLPAQAVLDGYDCRPAGI